MLNSQSKGKRFEREIASMLSEYFSCNVRRTPNSGGLSIKGDLLNLSGPLENWVFECKHQESIAIWKCIEQAQLEVSGQKKWCLIFRRNNTKPVVCIDLNDWMDLVERANYGDKAKANADNNSKTI